jgi:hypothetical protein
MLQLQEVVVVQPSLVCVSLLQYLALQKVMLKVRWLGTYP